MSAFDLVEWLPVFMLAAFVLVPASVVVAMLRSPEARAQRLGRSDFHAGIDRSDDFASYECGVAYRRGRSAAQTDVRQIEEYRLQREDMKRLREHRR